MTEHCWSDAGIALPTAADFPSRPATWYLFCRSEELGNRPLSKTIMQRRLVAFRDAMAKVAVLDASCAHLAADLGRGQIVDGAVQCPFHHWRYNSQGRCVFPPRGEFGARLPAVRSYPTVERQGYVYFFFGPRALFPLPFFPDCHPSDFAASPTFQFEMDTPWYMLVGNGFDTQHFHAVHERRLTNVPQIDRPAPFALRIRFETEVTGESIFDRLLKRFVGRDVRVSITSWGGPHVLVEGRFGRAHSRLLVASQPLEGGRTLSEVIAFARRSRSKTVDRINLRIRRRFTRAFMEYDIDKLAGVKYQPEGLTPHDQDMMKFFRWAAALPRSEYEEGA